MYGFGQKNRRGFSLIEVVIAAGMFSLVLMIFAWMMVFFFSRFYQSYGRASLKNDIQLFSKVYFPQLKNSVRLDPGEDIYIFGDAGYKGIIGLNQAVPGCDYEAINADEDEPRSILRYTVLRNRLGNERILRAWNDTSAGQVEPEHRLRVSYTDSGRQPFVVPGREREIVIIDVDGLYSRRFSVDGSERINTNLDPFDDQVVLDGGGNEIQFEYTSLILNQPNNALGNPLDPLNRWFITNSSIFVTNTHVICSKGDKVVDINESTGESSTILDLAIEAYSLERFTVSFGAIGNQKRVDSRQFKPYRYLSNDERDCFNVVAFHIEMKGRNSEDVDSARLMANLTNFQTRRPLKCDNL